MCVFQVDLLDTILVANDMLVEEMKENMDNMTKLFEEYKKAGYKPPNKTSEYLTEQIEKYTELMKNKQEYFPSSELCKV